MANKNLPRVPKKRLSQPHLRKMRKSLPRQDSRSRFLVESKTFKVCVSASRAKLPRFVNWLTSKSNANVYPRGMLKLKSQLDNALLLRTLVSILTTRDARFLLFWSKWRSLLTSNSASSTTATATSNCTHLPPSSASETPRFSHRSSPSRSTIVWMALTFQTWKSTYPTTRLKTSLRPLRTRPLLTASTSAPTRLRLALAWTEHLISVWPSENELRHT